MGRWTIGWMVGFINESKKKRDVWISNGVNDETDVQMDGRWENEWSNGLLCDWINGWAMNDQWPW